ncbi:Fe-S cluster assembly scaffold SufA [Vibrio sp. Of7-15]|uniref:Fe-S cluster assembly scaffold SufA n=1 Tax=Vibrio sp. Of7-15 TaxID=2724879 RepID=UPI001EF1FDF5|nr:Fe-S cluster assembly scaffold SufA [Vibrio sp. Of7-15]MCG7499761.1 Fe-S cluster assembly scaffold SufA [Vibrio sp. Of7-15]
MQNNQVTSFDPNDESWQGLELTDKAAAQINKLTSNDLSLLGVRLAVKPSGCAGFAYVLSMAKETSDDELIFKHLGACLFVPVEAMPYVDGTVVDFVSQGLNQMFQYNNPKVQNACGCGESFNV